MKNTENKLLLNTVLGDNSLSCAEKGVMHYFFAMQNDFSCTVHDLSEWGNVSIERCYSILENLIKAGYLKCSEDGLYSLN